jgi:septum formation protein
MLTLASNSTTRAKILKDAGIKFQQRSVDFDETTICDSNPNALVYKIAKGKFLRYTSLYGTDGKILCADTVVVCSNQVLGKAKDKEQARKMLLMQSGNKVEILTAMIYQSQALYLEELAKTTYYFDEYDSKDLNRYLNSNDWQGKAGACMVEGFCKPYIKKVIGYESTAKGLCIETLLPFLEF